MVPVIEIGLREEGAMPKEPGRVHTSFSCTIDPEKQTQIVIVSSILKVTFPLGSGRCCLFKEG
jgi:hypothetical protein